jgi:hypothetical protein
MDVVIYGILLLCRRRSNPEEASSHETTVASPSCNPGRHGPNAARISFRFIWAIAHVPKLMPLINSTKIIARRNQA